MINTLNETSLHKTIKDLYAIENPNSKKEEKVGPYIADIVTAKKDIIEIQTGSVSSLFKKINYFLNEGRKVKVVYPLAACKYIETCSVTKKEKRRRKSPVTKNIYSIFRELTGLHTLLLDKNFTLEVLLITMTEEREETKEAVQSKNGRRRFKKNWLKSGKRLESIEEKIIFNKREDYISLFPQDLGESFTINEMYQQLFAKKIKGLKKDSLRLMLWLYKKLDLVEECGKEGKSKVFKIKKAP